MVERAGGERRAATDASPQAASPQLNSPLQGREGEQGGIGTFGWREAVKSSIACANTESKGNGCFDLDGFYITWVNDEWIWTG